MRFFPILLFCLIIVGCYESQRDCAEYKDGVFEIEALSGTKILTTTVFRKDSIEIDFFEEKIDTSFVRWINDCEYIVKKINPRNKAEEKAIHIKILSTGNGTYTFEFKEVGKTKTMKATAKKID